MQTPLALKLLKQESTAVLIPRWPPFREDVTLRNLRIGQAAVDVMLHRHGTDVSLQVLRNEGHINEGHMKVATVYS
jgi:hypothetical protein